MAYSTDRLLIIAYRDSVPRPLCSSLFLRSLAAACDTPPPCAIAGSSEPFVPDSAAAHQFAPAAAASNTPSSIHANSLRCIQARALSGPHSCRCGSPSPLPGFCIAPCTPGALSFLLPSGPLSFFEFPCPSNRGRFSTAQCWKSKQWKLKNCGKVTTNEGRKLSGTCKRLPKIDALGLPVQRV